jgi:hypothetical protein
MQDATADRKGRTAETTKEDVEGTHSTIMERTSLPALKPEFGKRYFKTTIFDCTSVHVRRPTPSVQRICSMQARCLVYRSPAVV